MATAGSLPLSFTTGLNKPMGGITGTASIFYTVYDLKPMCCEQWDPVQNTTYFPCWHLVLKCGTLEELDVLSATCYESIYSIILLHVCVDFLVVNNSHHIFAFKCPPSVNNASAKYIQLLYILYVTLPYIYIYISKEYTEIHKYIAGTNIPPDTVC